MSEMIKLGGLWASKDKNGNSCMSGNFTYGSKLLILKNTFKKESKEPDYHIYLAKIEKENVSPSTPQTAEEESPF
jgi:hypothetical protein